MSPSNTSTTSSLEGSRRLSFLAEATRDSYSFHLDLIVSEVGTS